MSEVMQVVHVLGFDRHFVRSLRNILVHWNVRQTPMEQVSDAILKTKENEIVLIDLKMHSPGRKSFGKKLWRNVSEQAPIVFLSGYGERKKELQMIRELWEAVGASLIVDEGGEEEILEWAKHLSSRNPSEVITTIALSDGGLRVSFANGEHSVVPFIELKRLAETDRIEWNGVRIGPDRSYITVTTADQGVVPIPAELLAGYNGASRREQKKASRTQTTLTAKRFGERLRRIREGEKLSQEELARRMRKSRWTIIRIESGEYLPKVADLQKLAKALGKEVGEILA